VIWQLDLLLFLILVVLAVLALRVRDLMAAVAILSAFSLIVAIMFAGMAAVDVAFVEAVLGAGLTGILFIVLIRATGQRSEEIERTRPRWVLLPLIGAFAALMLYASVDLPDRGDPEAPAHGTSPRTTSSGRCPRPGPRTWSPPSSPTSGRSTPWARSS
jgi:uncharacterized MnhB-related membrane protein